MEARARAAGPSHGRRPRPHRADSAARGCAVCADFATAALQCRDAAQCRSRAVGDGRARGRNLAHTRRAAPRPERGRAAAGGSDVRAQPPQRSGSAAARGGARAPTLPRAGVPDACAARVQYARRGWRRVRARLAAGLPVRNGRRAARSRAAAHDGVERGQTDPSRPRLRPRALTSPACAGKLLYGIGRADEARAVGARATALRGLLHPMQAHAHKSALQLHV